MGPMPMHRYSRTSYEQELRNQSMRKGLSWAVFIFLVGTNVMTAIALTQARHNQVKVECQP